MGKLRLTAKERWRLERFLRVKRGALSLRQAAGLLKLSYRQAKRAYARYRGEGAAGLGHCLRGRVSNRRGAVAQRAAILQRYQERYADFGPTLAAEYLAKEQLAVPVQTLRRWWLEAGLWQVSRSRSAHRRWRLRKECFGEMEPMDGSHHDGFEGRRPWAVLMVMIDDATNRSSVRFVAEEPTAAALTTFQRYVARHGLPRSLYVDRDSIDRTTRAKTRDEALAGDLPMTQFGRAMKALAMELICAPSPQAKGRVERRHGVLQDRLVKALRLAGIATLEEANQFLERGYLAEVNDQFQVAPTRRTDVHRRLSRGVDLALVRSFQEQRVVQADGTVAWRRRWFPLTAANQKLALVGQHVTVCEQLDGKIRLRYQGRELAWEELPGRPKKTKREGMRAKASESARGPWKPAADHPWRRRG